RAPRLSRMGCRSAAREDRGVPAGLSHARHGRRVLDIFGIVIARAKDLATTVAGRVGWWPLIRDSFAGAWQRNISVTLEGSLSYWPVFRCVSIISSDIAKLGLNLVEQTEDRVWVKINSPAFSPVLRKPNRYQSRIQFFENWMQSKLTRGNTYVLKQRDARGV